MKDILFGLALIAMTIALVWIFYAMLIVMAALAVPVVLVIGLGALAWMGGLWIARRVKGEK